MYDQSIDHEIIKLTRPITSYVEKQSTQGYKKVNEFIIVIIIIIIIIIMLEAPRTVRWPPLWETPLLQAACCCCD